MPPAAVPDDITHRLGLAVVRERLRIESRIFARKSRPGFGGLISMNQLVRFGLAVMGLAGRARREFFDVRVVENPVVLPNLPPAFDGFRLLQLSDLHCDTDPALIPVIIDRLAGIDCDLVVLTGDYHNELGTPYDFSLELMIRLIPHLGPDPLAIAGNHDFLGMIPPLEEAGLRFLLNENVRLERGDAALWICGVDDPHKFRTHDLARARRGVPADDCAILLSHSPETFQEADAHGYALHLSGHTHGGQLCLPGGHAVVRKAAVPEPLIAGRWREGQMAGYTSRGTGSCNVAARLNCPPEMTLHILSSGSIT